MVAFKQETKKVDTSPSRDNRANQIKQAPANKTNEEFDSSDDDDEGFSCW
jgi:hypothetical protein